MASKNATILILQGHSCSDCRYRLIKERVPNYGRPHGHMSILKTVEVQSEVPHCALRTTIEGKFIERSELHDDTPCTHHWEKEKPRPRLVPGGNKLRY